MWSEREPFGRPFTFTVFEKVRLQQLGLIPFPTISGVIKGYWTLNLVAVIAAYF